VTGTVDVGVVPLLCLILDGGGVDGDAPGLLLGGLVDGGVVDVLGLPLEAEVLGDGGGEGGLAVVDMADGADWVRRGLPLQCALERSNLAKECVSLVVRFSDRAR